MQHLWAFSSSPGCSNSKGGTSQTSTRTVYRQSADRLVDHLAAIHVTDPVDIDKRHVQFIADQLATRSAATASVRFRALQQWFKWMTDEEEIKVNPMERMKAPIVPLQPPAVLEPDQIKALLAACQGNDFPARRDAAIVHLFLDTGARLTELTTVTLDDIDLSRRTVAVMGKGHRTEPWRSGSAPPEQSTATYAPGPDTRTRTSRTCGSPNAARE